MKLIIQEGSRMSVLNNFIQAANLSDSLPIAQSEYEKKLPSYIAEAKRLAKLKEQGKSVGMPGRGKATTDDFIPRAILTHHNNDWTPIYNYSKSEYKKGSSKLTIICSVHGEFEQIASGHLSSRGCKKCADKANGAKRAKGTTFASRSQAKHQNPDGTPKYTYDNFVYVNNYTKSWVTCPKHGDFLVTAHNHLEGSGCPKCAGKYIDFLSLEECQALANELGITNQSQWVKHWKENEQPYNVPAIPWRVYKMKSAEFFGNGNIATQQIARNNINALLSILNSFQDEFDKLNDVTKVNIIRQGSSKALLAKLKNHRPELAKISDLELATDKEKLSKAIALLEHNNEKLSKKLIRISNPDTTDVEDKGVMPSKLERLFKATTWKEIMEIFSDEALALTDLPSVTEVDNLLNIDIKQLMGGKYSKDSEIVQSFVLSAVYRLLDQLLSGKIDINTVPKGDENNEYANAILTKFWNLYNEAINLEIPEHNWEHDFNLMQRVIVTRLVKEKRLANFSGTGSGKTASAILASMVLNSHNTLIITENNTMEGWAEAILEIVPDCKVIVKDEVRGNKSSSNMYIIVNYERFQTDNADKYVTAALNIKPDLLIIDEMHKMKGGSREESIRRTNINKILFQSNTQYVLGMTATPLKNKLSEFKSVVESITGKEHKDLELDNTLENACLANTKVPLVAVRCKGKPPVPFTVHEIKTDGKYLVDDLVSLSSNHPANFSKALLDTKIRELPKLLGPNTIIYTQFVNNVVDYLAMTVENAGYSVGLYTGQENYEDRLNDLNAFKNGDLDVLIGSSAIGTGVDGLQQAAHTLIFITPPFTNADYEQTCGRIIRQGSAFTHVDIYHMIVEIIDKDEDFYWSWDRSMYERIKYKGDLAEAVLDGIIDLEGKIKPEELTAQAKQSLTQWVKRIKTKGEHNITRSSLIY